jgi:hypothetical protein
MRKVVFVLTIGLLFLKATGAVHAQTTPGQGAEAVKVCSILIPDTLRDTVTAMPTWRTAQCESFRAFIGGHVFQLGCFTRSGVSFGEPMDGDKANPENFPKDNSCNWAN